MRKVIVILISGLCTANTTLGDSWSTKAHKQFPSAMMSIGVVDGKIYVIGGHRSFLGDTIVEEYDPKTDLWVLKKPMPSRRAETGASTVNGKIYVIGGLLPGSDISLTGLNEEYDPLTDSWITKASMPTPRKFIGVAAFKNKIYAIGGFTTYDPTGVNEEYDPSTDTWTTKTPMPTVRCRFGIALLNGKIYAIGGTFRGLDDLRLNEEYDPQIDSWVTKAWMPTSRSDLTCAAVGDKLYAIGGFRWVDYVGTLLQVNEEYDQVTNSWSTKSPMPTPRLYMGSAVVDNRIYVIGGMAGVGVYLTTNEEYTPDLGVEELQNSKLKIQSIEFYPNPFSGTTKIGIQKTEDRLPEVRNQKSDVRLTIYDLTGRLVKSFPPTQRLNNSINSMTQVWDGSDDNGNRLPGGIYFCKLRIVDEIITKQLLLLR